MTNQDLFYFGESTLESIKELTNNSLELLQQGFPPYCYKEFRKILEDLRKLQGYSFGGYFLLNKDKTKGPLINYGKVVEFNYRQVYFNLINFDLLKPQFKVRIRKEYEDRADIEILTFNKLTLEPFIYSLWFNDSTNITAMIPYSEFYSSLEEKAEAERPKVESIPLLNALKINLGDPIVSS